MGRLATGFLVAAVLGLGVAAAIDGLRGRSEGGPPAALAGAASVSERGRAAATLRQAGVAGTLTYSDADCRPRALHLPSLRPASASPIESCEPYSEAGRLGVPEGAVVSKRLNQRLSERGWDGGFHTVQAVRLGGEAFAVLAESTYEPRERLVAGFDGSRLRFLLPRWRIGNPRLLRASPRGGYLALLDRDRISVRIFTGAGRELSLPPLPAPRAVAWSPDERWTAIATRESVYVLLTRQPRKRLLRIPVRVRDLDWGPASPGGERASLPLGARDLFRG
jgi:hypothetical protein